jgi:hypothetical protein
MSERVPAELWVGVAWALAITFTVVLIIMVIVE